MDNLSAGIVYSFMVLPNKRETITESGLSRYAYALGGAFARNQVAPSLGIKWRIPSESGGAFRRNRVAPSLGIKWRIPSEYADLSKVMLFVRPGMEKDLKKLEKLSGSLAGSTLIYSLWEGYKTRGHTKDLLAVIDSMGIKIKTLHTSGHADIPSLQQMVNTQKPKKLIPIHTLNPEEYAGIFECPVVTDSALVI